MIVLDDTPHCNHSSRNWSKIIKWCWRHASTSATTRDCYKLWYSWCSSGFSLFICQVVNMSAKNCQVKQEMTEKGMKIIPRQYQVTGFSVFLTLIQEWILESCIWRLKNYQTFRYFDRTFDLHEILSKYWKYQMCKNTNLQTDIYINFRYTWGEFTFAILTFIVMQMLCK